MRAGREISSSLVPQNRVTDILAIQRPFDAPLRPALRRERQMRESKEKLARAKNFISNAKSGEWILVRMSNTNHNSSGGQTQEEEELGGKFAPFQLIDQHAVQGHKTITKDNSKMYF